MEFLINFVRERPAIYDPSDHTHRERDVIAALWKEVAAALKCTGEIVVLFTMNNSIHKDMNYTLALFELNIKLIYYELNVRLIQQELYITGYFDLATQELHVGKQNILSRYHELPYLLL